MTQTELRAGRQGLPRGIRIALLLSPAMLVVGVFFLTGFAQAVAQSLGYQPFLPRTPLSLQAYRTMFADPAVRASLLLTLRVAIVPTVVSAVAGVCVALLIRRLGRSRRWVSGIFQANLAVPHLVGALCMLLLLSQGGLLSRVGNAVGLTDTPAAFPALTGDEFGWAIIAAYIWKETPFLTVIALAALGSGVDDLQDVARCLGARRWQRLLYVTLPVIAPAVAGGAVLVFAFTAGSYEVPYLLGRPFPATLPVVALQNYNSTDLTARPQALAIAVLITLLSGLMVAAYLFLAQRLARRPL